MPKVLKSYILLYQDNDIERSIISEGKFLKARTRPFFLRAARLPQVFIFYSVKSIECLMWKNQQIGMQLRNMVKEQKLKSLYKLPLKKGSRVERSSRGNC